MSNIQKYSDKTFEDIKHINEYGAEYWLARELAPVLEYARWENFYKVLEKAKEACENSSIEVEDHFRDVTKMIELAKGAQREIDDIDIGSTELAANLLYATQTDEKIRKVKNSLTVELRR
ncbi:MAG: BRO family protein [Bacillota bacterium]